MKITFHFTMKILFVLIIVIVFFSLLFFYQKESNYQKQIDDKKIEQNTHNEVAEEYVQKSLNLFSKDWQFLNDTTKATFYIEKAPIQESDIEGIKIKKVLIRYDYKYQDQIFGPDVRYAVFQIWLRPDQHSFRIIRRENYNEEGNFLTVRLYSISGKWEDYRENSLWRDALSSIAN